MTRIRFTSGASHYSLDRKIAKDFKSGKSMDQLRRKWGLPLWIIEEKIRKIVKAQKE